MMAVLSMGVREWIAIPVELHWLSRETGLLIQEIAAIVAALTIAYAAYGLYYSMKRIRERMGSVPKRR
ncbi:hypothetical protein KJ765_02955 [Candidatus Micrarchaeota archaeon]|nr:hypothetical protein [Candidatus Micrarchaeota archaeon]